MKQKAPRPEPQSNSPGLRVVIGQNSWNRVGLEPDGLVVVSDSGSVLSWWAESGCGVDSEPVCGGAAGEAEVSTVF